MQKENDLDLLLYQINIFPEGKLKDVIIYKQKIHDMLLVDVNYISIQDSGQGLEFCSNQKNKLLIHTKTDGIIKLFDYFPLRIKHFHVTENISISQICWICETHHY